jgi:hypothetical protein
MVLRELALGGGLDSFGSIQGPVAGSCERGNEPMVGIPCVASQEELSSMELVS